MWRRSIQVLALVAVGSLVVNAQSPAPATYYPGREWRTATPNRRASTRGAGGRDRAGPGPTTRRPQPAGDPARLRRRRRGFLPVRSAAPHDIASVTKTLTSTLTGVAVANGLLKLDRPVLVVLPERVARRCRRQETRHHRARPALHGVGPRLRLPAGRAGTGTDEAVRELGAVRAVAADEERPGHAPVLLQPGLSPARLGDRRGGPHQRAGVRAQSICSTRSRSATWCGATIRRGAATAGATATSIRATSRSWAICICTAVSGRASRSCRATGWPCRSTPPPGGAHRAGRLWRRVGRHRRRQRPPVRRHRPRRPEPDCLARPRHDRGQHRRWERRTARHLDSPGGDVGPAAAGQCRRARRLRQATAAAAKAPAAGPRLRIPATAAAISARSTASPSTRRASTASR